MLRIRKFGVRVGALLVLGYHSSGLFRACSTFLIVGTSCAVQVPVVGWTPFTSMEQIGPLVVGVVVLVAIVVFAVLAACAVVVVIEPEQARASHAQPKLARASQTD